MQMKNKDVSYFSDSNFICNLTFLTDLADHLNTLNLQLYGKKQLTTQMHDCVVIQSQAHSVDETAYCMELGPFLHTEFFEKS